MGEGEEEQLVPESEESPAESADETDGEEKAALQVQKLREKLKRVLAEKQEYLEGWQRSRADFINYKKDEAAREARAAEQARAAVVQVIIPTLDSLESACKNHPTKELSLLQKQLLDSLKTIRVERFGKEGEDFDPRRHEAIRQIPADSHNAHTVASVERSGYKIGDIIIRPAHVTIYG